jgi:DNA-binding transcriptional MerR regulator
MLIGEIVEKSGLTKDTIRFYEKKGLIKVGRSTSEWNNYKNYSSEVLNQLFLIKKAKGFGFTLNEIAELLELIEKNEASCTILSNKVKKKLNDIDQKIKELQSLKKIILSKVNGTSTNCVSNGKNNCKTIEIDKTA